MSNPSAGGDDALFDLPPMVNTPTEPAVKLSPDARRTQHQLTSLRLGWHPLGSIQRHPLRLHAEAAPADDKTAPGRRCGNCWHREVVDTGHARAYPKCLFGEQPLTDTMTARRVPPPRASLSAASDCRAWWPACVDHVWADPAVPDAARHVPGSNDEGTP